MKAPDAKTLSDIRDRWFKDHVATIQTLAENIYRIKWAKPGSNTYAIRYILDHGTLLIWGDLGEAIYQWNANDLTFEQLAGFDLHYFESKLRASEDGREFYTFDVSPVIEELRTLRDEDSAVREDIDDDDISRIESEQEVLAVMMKIGSVENETLSSILDAGKSMHPRLVAHWIGIKMAVEQLQAKAASPA